MGGVASRSRGSVRENRRALAERLRENSAELEEAIFDQICAAESAASQSPPPMRGIRSVVRSALEHGIDSVEIGQQDYPPSAVIDHARKAAWRSVPLQTLYDHYLTGYSVFKHFLLRESDSVELVQQVQGSLDVAFQQLTRAVAEEHKQAHQKRIRSSDIRRLERVEELLSGKLLEAPDLQYPLSGTHVGIVASGPEISATIRRLFQLLGSTLLLVNPGPNKAWVWMTVKRELTPATIGKLLPSPLPSATYISFGQPAEGLQGWRRTHEQALAASSLIPRMSGPVVHYGDVAVLASMAQDPLLQYSLKASYLAPLTNSRSGHTLCTTVRAYLQTERNTTSAAAALGVSRQTVSNHLKMVEELLDRPLPQCLRALDAALQLRLDQDS